MKYNSFLNGKSVNDSGIYSIENLVNGKIYIGSAANFRKRWNGHWHSLCKNTHRNNHLQSAWNMYGEDNFIFSIIETVRPEDLLIREQFYLDTFKDQKDKLYNMNLTAGSNLGVKFNDHFRKNISNKRKAFFQTPEGLEARETLRKSTKERMNGPDGEEIKRKIKEKTLVHVKSAEGRRKNSEGQKRRYEDPVALEQIRDASGSRWILCEQTGQKFHGAAEAARIIGVGADLVLKVCKGIQKQASGFTFRFCEKHEIVTETKPPVSKPPRTKGTRIVCVETGEVFENCRLAAERLGLERAAIFKVLKGTWRHTHGYTFRKA